MVNGYEGEPMQAGRHERETGAAERSACELQAPGRRLDRKKPFRPTILSRKKAAPAAVLA